MNTTLLLPAGVSQLTSIALIGVSGTDAASFLHGQLTNDIQALSEQRACLAGYCSPKGRLLASLLVWKLPCSAEDSFVLETSGELQESLQKRLQMYVLRSKVKLTHLTPSNVVLGILGDAIHAFTPWFASLPGQPYAVMTNEVGTLIRLTDVGQTMRFKMILDKDKFDQIWPVLSKKIALLPENTWALSEIHASIPHITLATQEKFVPQMINYELIGAINFKKGCYPGQEIVARTHYLGKQKRRTVLAHIDHPTVQSGMEVFAQQDPEQPCGMVVNAQPSHLGGSDCLIEIKTTYLNEGVVALSSGEVCRWLPMPYPLPVEGGEST